LELVPVRFKHSGAKGSVGVSDAAQREHIHQRLHNLWAREREAVRR